MKRDQRGAQRMWTALGVAAALAVAICGLAATRTLQLPPGSAAASLWFEVFKSSLQAVTIVTAGAVATAATGAYQQRRQVLEARTVQQRADLARQEEFLGRATQLFQRMFVVCQGVRRTAHGVARGNLSKEELNAALERLGDTYLEFSAESRALDTQLRARYTARTGSEEQARRVPAYEALHQLGDLLTLYYFNLQGRFPGDALRTNSRSPEALHSGLDAVSMIADPLHPTDNELRAMRNAIRVSFEAAITRLAVSLVEEEVTKAPEA